MYEASFREERPVGLRRRSFRAGTELWRIEATDPGRWTWVGHPEQRHRFDPASGAFRTRDAGQSFHGVARERYLDTGLFIPADHDEHWVVRLTTARRFSVLDLRTEANLAALAVDDR